MKKVLQVMVVAVCFCFALAAGTSQAAAPSSGRASKIVPPVFEAPASINQPMAGSNAYALEASPGSNLVRFNTDDPTVWTVIGPVTNRQFFAGDFLNGDNSTLYAISYSENNLYTIDTKTAADTLVGACTSFGGEGWTGMTSTVDGPLYASSTSISRSTLYTIDPATGTATVIGEITNAPGIIDIAINSSNALYGVDIINDSLISIDPSTGAGTIIGALGFNANYAQGMSFDWNTGVLYLAAFNDTAFQGELRTADTATGSTTLVGAFPGGAEVDCLAFVSNCIDNDNDTYGHYCAAGPDCNDNDSAIHATVTYYPDADGDGYGIADNTTEFCSLTPPAGYADNSSGFDVDDTDPFYTDFLPTCEVKIIPKTLGWLVGDKEKTRSLLVIGKRGTEFGDNPAIKWESDAIEVVRTRVFFKRFLFIRAKFNGEPLDPQEYRVLVGDCEGSITWAK